MRTLITISMLAALSTPVVALAQLPSEADAPTAELAPKDPTEDASGFFEGVKDAFAASRFVGVVLLLWGVARVAHRFQDSIGFLKTPARRAVLVGAIGILAAVLASIGADGRPDWQTVLGAVLAQIALYVTPEPKPKAAPQ